MLKPDFSHKNIHRESCNGDKFNFSTCSKNIDYPTESDAVAGAERYYDKDTAVNLKTCTTTINGVKESLILLPPEDYKDLTD